MPRYSWTKHPEIDRLRATTDDARVKVIKHPPYRRLETLEQGTTLNEQHVFTVVHPQDHAVRRLSVPLPVPASPACSGCPSRRPSR